MKQGTRSTLIGCHQFIWHPLFVIIGWVMRHSRFPKFWEIVCIFVHDWGVWGTDYLSDPKNKKLHPELGAKIAKKFFGNKGWHLVAGHSLEYIKYWDDLNRPLFSSWDKIEISDLYYADKYSYLVIPNFLLRLQAWGEKNMINPDSVKVRMMAITALSEKRDLHEVWVDQMKGEDIGEVDEEVYC